MKFTLERCLRLLNPIRVSRNIAWRYLSGRSGEPHVFVSGAPRSGTTLMYMILKSHPAFSGVDNETYFFMPRDIFSERYGFFSYAGGVSPEEYIRLQRESKDIVNFYDNLARFILERDRTRRFVEKTPHHLLYLRFLVKHFPNAKFVITTRDGRDCYVSHKRLEAHLHGDIRNFAHLWRKMTQIRQSLGKHPQIIDVFYEEFTQNPQETIQRVMDFLDEPPVLQQLDPQIYSNTSMKALKGHSRLSQPITAASVGQWRKKMTEEDIRIFNQIAGKELMALGYEVG